MDLQELSDPLLWTGWSHDTGTFDIINSVEAHSLTDPDRLLPRHCFLMDADFEALGSGPPSDRLVWIADMDSAIAVSMLSHAGTLIPAAQEHFAQAGRGRSTTALTTDA